MAEVGGEGDEEDEQGDDDDDDEQLLDDDDDKSREGEGLDIDLPHRTFSQRLEEDARELGDWADEIGRLANQRAERERVLRDHLTQSGNPPALSSVNELPDVRDPLMYCFCVKRGKATSLTFALMRKIIADTKARYTQIYSVFSVPTITDRIYIEALGMAPVYLLCTNMQGIYKDSWHAVSVLERVSILEGRVMPRINTGMREDSIVKIRDGRYRDDHGFVVSVSKTRKRFVVKLKSRENMPGELKRKIGRNPAFLLTKEAARNLGMKSVLQEHPGDPANANYEDLREGEVESESDARHLKASFRFNGKTYTFDGHLLLEFAMDQVERVVPGQTCDSNVDNELILASNPIVHNNISEGHEVWVTDGEARGSCGRVVELNFGGFALVEIQEHGPSSSSRPAVLLELNKRHLVRKLNIGDRVEVKIGIYVGVKGIVGSINTKKGFGNTVLGIVELNDDLPEDREVLVPIQFVDTIDSLDDSTSVLGDEFVEGQHVIIFKGKLQGKTGVVALIEKYHIRLLEDGTSCESIREYNEERYLQWMPARPPTPVKIEEVPLILCDGNDPIDVDALDIDDDKCLINHLEVGFEDSIVYVWRGIGKGKLARVIQATGSVTKIQFDSALHGSSISFAKARNLLAYVIDLPS
ncbi:hypothetical protein SCHPADRAFT_947544 [Schizopora paradoxa]|uniref:Chromatin elongation factor SPT5 n=1 Tax=Schizopora paradoxa TaxID=27342 RepID=A0A0H2QZ57_9AGAM|nr:hypothetical protein SCHPADRAFT_947544 [Schizopora paradoxa]